MTGFLPSDQQKACFLGCHLQIASNYLQTVVFHITRDVSVSQNHLVTLPTSPWPWGKNLQTKQQRDLLFCAFKLFQYVFLIFQVVWVTAVFFPLKRLASSRLPPTPTRSFFAAHRFSPSTTQLVTTTRSQVCVGLQDGCQLCSS